MITPNEHFNSAVNASLPDQLALIGLLAVILALGLVARTLRKRPRRKRRTPNIVPIRANKADTADKTDNPDIAAVSGHVADPKVQMELVSRAEFSVTPVLNKEEYRVLPVLESVVRDLKQGHRVIIQASLGEIIKTSGPNRDISRRAHSSINSKRIDFGVIDRFGMLKAAIEYQGSGHYNSRTFMRDAVKREALRKAGVNVIEVQNGFSPGTLRADLLHQLGGDLPAPRTVTSQRARQA